MLPRFPTEKEAGVILLQQRMFYSCEKLEICYNDKKRVDGELIIEV